MTRLHFVKRARKTNKAAGVKRGESYYWWKFARSPKQFSKTQPARSAYLTRSEYLGTLYDLEDGLAKLDTGGELSDIAGELNSAADEVETLGQEQSDKRDAMPEQLQDVGSGELLQNRADFCEELAQALRDAAGEVEGWTDDDWEAEPPDHDIDGDADQDDAEADGADEAADDDEAHVQRQREFVQEQLDGIDWSTE